MKDTIERPETPTSWPRRIPAMAEVNAILADYIELRELMEDFVGEDDLEGQTTRQRLAETTEDTEKVR